ncbi:hypothetical protein TNIN_442631 [Trichonephila inaurata madagascariensis]|uniref:Uncharacterized protein n=1 Tax=Trichonephila inaurata madagascariensis TaxID=2747483 RepID=A0A8X7BU84_9ARAC|nr:hypothetical protein TNIN_442631 [Trichonephila inaurata madagascariensis]
MEIRPFDAISWVFPELFAMLRGNKMTLGCSAFGNSLDAVRKRRNVEIRKERSVEEMLHLYPGGKLGGMGLLKINF